jgi:predicted transcriptional regulator
MTMPSMTLPLRPELEAKLRDVAMRQHYSPEDAFQKALEIFGNYDEWFMKRLCGGEDSANELAVNEAVERFIRFHAWARKEKGTTNIKLNDDDLLKKWIDGQEWP